MWRVSALVFHFMQDLLQDFVCNTDAVIYGNIDVGFTFMHHLGRVTEGDTYKRDHHTK